MKVCAPRLAGPVRYGVCAFGVLLLSALPCGVQAQEASSSFAQGTHLFRNILYDLHLQPLRNRKQLVENPENKLLIMLGETEIPLLAGLDLEEFVQQGGAVLFATDRDCDRILRPFGVRVVGQTVNVSTATGFAYKGATDCIFVMPHGPDNVLFKNLSVEKGLSQVATNRPGYLVRSRESNLQVLATFPPDCTYGRFLRLPEKKAFPFAVGGSCGLGRILILSDHSVFINAMMWQPDLDNFDFAYNCLNWLSEGKRTHVLFLEEGQIQDKFEIPLKEPPVPPLPPLKAIIETVDKALVDLEKNDAFNAAIGEAVKNLTWPPDKWVQQVVLMSTLGLAIFGLARLTQARQRHDKALMLARSSLEKTPPAISLIEQRNQSLLQEGNYWESARALARQAFDAALAPEQLAAGAAAKPPRLPIRGRWRQWRLRRRIDRLWRLAYGTKPFRISSRRLKRLALEIETLKTLLARLGLPRGPSPTQQYNTDERKVAE